MTSTPKNAVTLVELLIAFSIFLIVMGLVLAAVTGVFRSSSQMQSTLNKEQRQRMCFVRLSREVNSMIAVRFPEYRFKGDPQGFFFIFAREEALAESKYAFNSEAGTLDRYYQEPSDYNQDTYQMKDTCLDSLGSCSFSYSDGAVWHSSWEESKQALPRMIKVSFKFREGAGEREFLVHIPASQ